ncbi:flagellar export chaperone FliS [Xylanimonas oleitrophica]|uniref:Flagellar export chaperone FliS n=1 Tax=Xylanimonas oleitrophica TaxID=2607479 RepID=A0A2W5WTD1_9MICO|nr:flagellar export chaperone FliS [Xylanimonas oleitrophica]PZR54122.1 flagellar export chaperone FliS [Xylanimonas oleitrophica]
MNVARQRFLEATVATASPAKLLTLLYDRLVLDLHRGAESFGRGDVAEGRTHTDHAQDIVTELMDTLDVEAWPEGRRLRDVYAFLLSELLTASTDGDAARVSACYDLVLPLAEAWREAAAAQASSPDPAGTAPGGLLGVG